jgi:hypothetical protein
MKIMKSKRLIALAIILATFGSVSANVCNVKFEKDPNKNITIQEFGNLKFKISITEKVNGMANFKISDETGNVVYNETMEAMKLNRKLFDLSSLSDGKYTFNVRINGTTEVQTIYLKTQINRSALLASN